MKELLDIIVFGATGHTGKFTLPWVYKLTKSEGRSLTWGIAGRSKQKLQDVLTETAERLGLAAEDLESVPIITADYTNRQSLKDMTACAKVIINCSGPYEFYGRVIIQSCIATGTHYVDVSGEMLFIEQIEAEYFTSAAEKKVYIVNTCGFDSVASDLGVTFLENNFKGQLNSVESYLAGHEEGGWTPGTVINSGTWNSAVYAAGNFRKLLAFRKALKLEPLAALKHISSMRFPIRRVNLDGKGCKWTFPFPLADYDVMKRTQRYFYSSTQKPPIQTYCYIATDSLKIVLQMLFYMLLLVIFSQFEFGRNLLIKYPKFFTNGLFSSEKPVDKKMDRIHFSATLYGEGWSEKLPKSEKQYKTSPNKAIVGQVRGTNPGYGFTCFASTLCAIMILTEKEKLPPKGGIFTPGAAFSKTSLIRQLQKHGATFEILSITDI